MESSVFLYLLQELFDWVDSDEDMQGEEKE
jgi:hypothetical protein